jgi:hypothetical protein
VAASQRFDSLNAPPEGGFDLRALLRATGGRAWQSGSAPSLERSPTRSDVELLDDTASELTAEPLEVAGFADGVQATRCVAWRSSRPVDLVYCAAGALLDRATPVGLNERLVLAASVADHDWVRSLPGGLPVAWVDVTDPPDVALALHDCIGDLRAHLEDELADDLVAKSVASRDRPLVVDGDLRAKSRWSHGPAVVAVAKTHRTRWLPDESSLWGLPEGWISPRFRILAGGPVGVDRYSCYLRLRSAAARPWNFGLIRLEVTQLDQLEPLAALAFSLRQSASAPDGRWDRQLAPVRAVEEWLAARRPLPLRAP